MHRFHPEDSAVLFLDGFGLTRLEFPKKIKTDRKIRGGWDGYINISDNGERALVYDADWWRIYTYLFPSLKPWHKYERFKFRESHLLADGEHLLDEKSVRTMEGAETGTWTDEGVKELPPLVFGAQRDIGYYIHSSFPARTSGAGQVIECVTPDWKWLIQFGVCTPNGGRVQWRRELKVHGGHRHGVYPYPGGFVLTSYAPCAGEIHALWVDDAGAPGRQLQAPGCSVPVANGGRLAWQQDDDTIVVEDGEGKRQHYSIREATAVAHRAKKHPRALAKGDFLGDLTNVGPGQVLLGAHNLLFVPSHGATGVDLIRQSEIHRKLPPDEFVPRQNFRTTIGRANAFAREADILMHGGHCEINKKEKSIHTSFSLTRGEAGFVGLMVGAATAAHITEDKKFQRASGWTWHGGSGGASDTLSGTYGVEDVLRVFQIFDDYDVPLNWASGPLKDGYERRLEESTSYYGEVLGPVLTRDAEKLLIHAFSQHRTLRKQGVKLLSQVPAWREAELRRKQYRGAAKQDDLFKYFLRSYFDGELNSNESEPAP